MGWKGICLPATRTGRQGSAACLLPAALLLMAAPSPALYFYGDGIPALTIQERMETHRYLAIYLPCQENTSQGDRKVRWCAVGEGYTHTLP